jgi:hypothetical protein
VNNRQTGEVACYTLSNSSTAYVGDYVEGTMTDTNMLTVDSTTHFCNGNSLITPKRLLLFYGGDINGTTLSFDLKSLGAEVIGIRARVNGIDMPNAFGVSPESPLTPMSEMVYTCKTSWRVPGGGTAGYVPEDGDRYNVTVTVKLSDYSIQAFKYSGVYKTSNVVGIPSVAPRGGVFFLEPDLLWLGRGEGCSLSLSFFNDWAHQEAYQTLDHLQVFVDGETVWSENVTVSALKHFIVTVPVPGDLEPGQRYNVTLVAHSLSGLNSTYTVPTLCQNARIQ